jgi:hypothetical protein
MSPPPIPPAALLAAVALSSLMLASCGQEPPPPQPLGPPEQAPDTAAAQGSWSRLQSLTGQLPSESGLFDTSPIAASLKSLLGDHFNSFRLNFQVEAPLQAEGDLLYTSGNRPLAGGTDQAYLIISPKTQTLEVGLWDNGQLTTFKSPDAEMTKPTDIQTMISNAAG